MIPKKMLQDLGWSDDLIKAVLKPTHPVEPLVIDAATLPKQLLVGIHNKHGTNVDVRSRPPVGSSSLRFQPKN